MRNYKKHNDTNHQHEYRPNCPISKGAVKAQTLEELQKNAVRTLGVSHLSIGTLAYLAETSGRESVEELAGALHTTPENVRTHRKYIRGTLIPELRNHLSSQPTGNVIPLRTSHRY